MPHEDSVLSLIYLLVSNFVFITLLVCAVVVYMLSHGYKSITIKLKKNKQVKSSEKINEERYLSRLEKNIKQKNKK